MANLRRRSARLSKASPTHPSPRKTQLVNAPLESLVERDETPDVDQQSIDRVLATPATSRTVRDHLTQLSGLRTPQTEPKPGQAEMNPKTAHRSTAKAPDSGLKLGFSDITTDKTHNTPSKPTPRQSVPAAATFEFKFSSESHLSKDAQALMDNVREDAAKIKAQMLAERAAQDQKDQEAEGMFGAGRKIAKPRGKAGRFSDVHMAQFKKMDSIANHASALRSRPGFAAPTAQSLKRSPSRAGLDELERSRNVGRSTIGQPRRVPPPIIGRPNSTSPFKSITITEPRSKPGPTKRIRNLEHQDVSDSRPTGRGDFSKSSTLYSPTKSSLSRLSQDDQIPSKPSMIPRSHSNKGLMATQKVAAVENPIKPVSIPALSKPLPPIPNQEETAVYPTLPVSLSKTPPSSAKHSTFTSKLPTLTGLKSILRGSHRSPAIVERPGTPKRLNTVSFDNGSARKVDFTPSVKSRHAVKLAADSPSPAKIRRDTPYKSFEPVHPYDASAYVLDHYNNQDWEDEESTVVYPKLPPSKEIGTDTDPFSTHAKNLNRRESQEFKSIFTTLRPSQRTEPVTLTSINTAVNKTNPESHANKVVRSPGNLRTKALPSTIRHTDHLATDLVQPFEDKLNPAPHGLPGKKRNRDTIHDIDKHGIDEAAKENRRVTHMPSVPGGWDDSNDDTVEAEADTRAGKRVRTSTVATAPANEKSGVRKPNAAREAAAKNAKDRKGRAALSLSRLNMLSRPKSRG